MKFLKKLNYWAIACAVLCYACSDPVAERQRELDQIKADSVAQADIDNAAIDAYILDAGLDIYQDSIATNGMRYIVLDSGSSTRYPMINDILSVDYLGRFTDGEAFETTSRAWAMTEDSTDYVENGVDVAQVMTDEEMDLEEALIYLSTTPDALNFPLLSRTQIYTPIGYNHSEYGIGLRGSYVTGFADGLHTLIPQLKVGGKGVIFIPSAVGYGIYGSQTGAIPPNTPILFEVQLVDIRP